MESFLLPKNLRVFRPQSVNNDAISNACLLTKAQAGAIALGTVLQPMALGKHLPENFKDLDRHIPQNKGISNFDCLQDIGEKALVGRGSVKFRFVYKLQLQEL